MLSVHLLNEDVISCTLTYVSFFFFIEKIIIVSNLSVGNVGQKGSRGPQGLDYEQFRFPA